MSQFSSLAQKRILSPPKTPGADLLGIGRVHRVNGSGDIISFPCPAMKVDVECWLITFLWEVMPSWDHIKARVWWAGIALQAFDKQSLSIFLYHPGWHRPDPYCKRVRRGVHLDLRCLPHLLHLLLLCLGGNRCYLYHYPTLP